MTRFVLLGVLAVAVLFGVAWAPVAATPPTDKDLAAKAKALVILSCGDKSECHLVKKAAEVLVVAKAEALHVKAVAPSPREKKAGGCAHCGGDGCGCPKEPDACPDGTCPLQRRSADPAFPVIPGYERGSDGVYRQVGVARPAGRR